MKPWGTTTVEKEVQGLSALLADLKTLPARVEKNVMRGALRKGMTVFQKAVKANVPIGKDRKNWRGEPHKAGELQRSVKMKAFNDPLMPRVKLYVGNYEAFYAVIVEVGAKPHKTWVKNRNPVQHPGFKGRRFVRRAFYNQEQAAIDAFKAYLPGRIQKELQKQSSG